MLEGGFFTAALALVGIVPAHTHSYEPSLIPMPVEPVGPCHEMASPPQWVPLAPSPKTRNDFGGARTDPQIVPRHGNITVFGRGTIPPAVKVLGVRDGMLRIGSDAARIGPRTILEAAGQFSDLIRDAIRQGYFDDEVRFSDLAKIYALISEQFEWPAMKDKRLSMLLVACGAERFTRSEKRQKFRVLRFENLPMENAA